MMNKKRINEILAETGIDFVKTDKTLYINFIFSFNNSFDSFQVEIIKGLNSYKYYNFYEVMMWYRYYICPRRNITTNPEDGFYSNASYFSRIPSHYRTTSQEKGLSVIKEAISLFIDHYNGMPKYFTFEELDELCYIK